MDADKQQLNGKTAVVTGGSSGIGFAIAGMLAEMSVRVLIAGRNDKRLKHALSEISRSGREVYACQADMSKHEDIVALFDHADETLGGLDILVNNAGVGSVNIQDNEYPEYDYVIRTNLLGYMACAQQAIRRMKAGKGGHIINIGSMSADFCEPRNEVYAASKAGVRAFSNSLSKSLNDQHIKVSLIEPGWVATEGMGPRDEETRQARIDACEILIPDDIASCVRNILAQPWRCDTTVTTIRPFTRM